MTIYTKFGYASVDLGKLEETGPPKEEQEAHDSSGSAQNHGESIIEVRYNWGLGFIQVSFNRLTDFQRKEIRSKIKVQVKTFHGNRTNYEFIVSITDKLDRLRELLCQREPEEMTSYHVIKFIYAMGTMRTLALDQSFEQQEIPHGAQLVLLGQKTFTWDLNYKGSNI